MNAASWLLWGGVATLVLTTSMSLAQGLGWTRMNIPYLLGTMLARHRDRAQVIGVVVHLANGWLFALLYVAAFEAWGVASVFRGAVIGFVHAMVVLSLGMKVLPELHPRMARENADATDVRVLEPPGFLALHYGAQTPISVVMAHVVYGAILGAFYELA